MSVMINGFLILRDTSGRAKRIPSFTSRC